MFVLNLQSTKGQDTGCRGMAFGRIGRTACMLRAKGNLVDWAHAACLPLLTLYLIYCLKHCFSHMEGRYYFLVYKPKVLIEVQDDQKQAKEQRMMKQMKGGQPPGSQDKHVILTACPISSYINNISQNIFRPRSLIWTIVIITVRYLILRGRKQ